MWKHLLIVSIVVNLVVAWNGGIATKGRTVLSRGLVYRKAATLKKEEVNEEVDQVRFDWNAQWYPLAVTEYLDEKRPMPLQLMGKELVAWKSEDGWKVFDDACPHRLAPLSEGRVEADGTLLCAYHAWRFDAKGDCVAMPQAKNLESFAQCSVPAYPVREIDGLLWVYADNSEDGFLKAALSQPAIRDEIDDPKAQRLYWNVRDLPYSYDFFIENVVDPAHVTVSHHNVVGNRYVKDQYYDMKMMEAPSTQGFKMSTHPREKTAESTEASIEYRAPALVKIETIFPQNQAKQILYLYVAPSSKPGFSRHIGCQVLVKGNDNKLPGGLAFFALPMPIWLNHILASLFLHQDQAFLHHQEQILAARGYNANHHLDHSAQQDKETKYSSLVFSPNPQDKMVLTFRNWLRNYANGGVTWASSAQTNTLGSSRITDSRQLFDVWNSHTKHCRVCLNALKNIKRFRFFTSIAAAVTLATVKDTLRAILGASFFGVLALISHKLISLFYVYEFSHADND